MIALSVLSLVGSYQVTIFGVAVVFQRCGFPAKNGAANFVLSWLLGPILIAWLLWIGFKLVPSLPKEAYMIGILLPFIAIPLVFRSAAQAVLGDLRALVAQIYRHFSWRVIRRNLLASGLFFGAGILFFITIYNIAVMPVIASDPLEYASLARLIAEQRSLANYPLDSSLEGGFYARSSHPPAFHLMIAWAYFFEPNEVYSSRLFRFIQVHYLTGALLVMFYAAWRPGMTGYIQAGFAVLFLLGTPFYIALVTAFHIDPVRIPLMFLGMVIVYCLLHQMDFARKTSAGLREALVPALITGFSVGLGMFAHSIGLLLVFFATSAYFFLCRQRLFLRFAIPTLIGLAALTIGSGQFIENTIRFGVPLHDTEPVWELESVDHQTDVRYRRDLADSGQRLGNGLLVWFNNSVLYGQAHWLALVFGLVFFRSLWRDPASRVYALAMFEFYFVAAITMVIGIDMVIKNIRYMLTVLPFVVYVAAIGVTRAYVSIDQILLGRSRST